MSSKRRLPDIESLSILAKKKRTSELLNITKNKRNASDDDAEPVDDDNSATDGADVNDADNAAESESQFASTSSLTQSTSRGAASQAKEPNYNLRVRGAFARNDLGGGGAYHMNGYGSTSASERDRQYWAPNSRRDYEAFQARLRALKLLQREFGDNISYPQEYAEALGLSSSRDACVATEFPDGVEEVKEDNTQMWYVERIVAHRKESHGTSYLVKWRGWPNSCNSWEPAESVYAPEQISMYYKKYGAKPPNTLRTVTFDQGGKIKKLDRIKASEIAEPRTRKR